MLEQPSACVYKFTIWDQVALVDRDSQFMATLETIRLIGGVPVEGTMTIVSPDTLDTNGVYLGEGSSRPVG
jgi:hypothetical protein